MSESADRMMLPLMVDALKMQQRYVDLWTKSAILPFRAFGRPTQTRAVAVSPRSPSVRDEEVIVAAEETLNIAKEVVQGDTTRIIRTVVESPVERQVELLTQTVVIERRPSTGSTVAGDVLSDRIVEMHSTDERAVVSKGRRIIEEIVLRRETTARIETIAGTIRRDQIDIQQPNRLPAVIKLPEDNHDGEHDKNRNHKARSNG